MIERERDPWTKPVLIFAGLIALYFIWQFLGR